MFSLDPWSFPKSLRPDPLKLEFDIEQRLDALLQLHIQVPDHAYTAPILGTTRSGHGVVIDSEGHILTIGYLVPRLSKFGVANVTAQSCKPTFLPMINLRDLASSKVLASLNAATYRSVRLMT